MLKLTKAVLATFVLASNIYAAKIVSVGGSITETIVALGHKDDLIGIDKSSVYPKEALKDLPKVGYWMQLPKEGILSLKPEVVITSQSAKPQKLIESLPKYGIKTYVIEDKASIESAKNKITQVAAALGEEQKAKKIIARIEKNIAKINNELKTKSQKAKVLFLFSRSKGLMMAAGTQTRAGKMISLAGGVNAIDANQYTKISEESILKINPDVIIVSKHRGSSLETKGVISTTKAGINSQIYNMDILLMSGFTVRIDEALEKLSCMLNKNSLSFCK